MKNKRSEQMQQLQEPAGAEDALAPELAGLRQRRIAARAYSYAEGRDFTGDEHIEDWLRAEREIDAEDAGS